MRTIATQSVVCILVSSTNLSLWSPLKPQISGITSQPCQARPRDEDVKPLSWSEGPRQTTINMSTFQHSTPSISIVFSPSEGFIKISKVSCGSRKVFTEVVTCGGLADIWRQNKQRDLICSSDPLSPHHRSCRPRQMGFWRFSIPAGHNAASRQLNGYRL